LVTKSNIFYELIFEKI